MPREKVSAVMFCKQFLAYAVHIDWCYHSFHKHSSRSRHAPIWWHRGCIVAPSRVDIYFYFTFVCIIILVEVAFFFYHSCETDYTLSVLLKSLLFWKLDAVAKFPFACLQQLVREHCFNQMTFYSAAYCNHCQDLIWGIAPQGYQCASEFLSRLSYAIYKGQAGKLFLIWNVIFVSDFALSFRLWNEHS